MKFLFGATLLALALVGCEKGDEDRVAKAQNCLDTSTQATVSSCETIVEGVSGAGAALIRCSAKFIYQGFTGTRFAQAFTNLKSPTAGQNATLAMMSYLVFTVGATDAARRTAASQAVSACTQSGLPGMIMFANFASAATEIATNVGLTIDPANPPSSAALQAALASYAGDPAALGTSILAISSVYCSGDSSTKDVTFCAAVNEAAAENGATAVGTKILQLLAQTS